MAITRITKGVIKPNENYDTHNINSTGIVTATGLDINGNADVSGALSVGGVLTYEDVTSIDSVGIITARSGLVSPNADIDDFISVGSNIHLGNAGVITATSFVGDGSGLIGVASTDNIITGTAATFNTYPVDINAGMDVAGVTTAVTVDINGDIDVDGHTNLDNVSVSGISTFSGILDATNTPASIRVAQEIQHKGDADTALSFGTDIISLKTAGTERLRIQADGDVSFGDETTGRAQIKYLSGDQANRNAGGFPQYAFVGNEGTGMRRVSSNVLAFDTTGEERIRIDSNGNISVSNGRLLLGTINEGAADADDLTIATSGNTGITIRSGTTHNGSIYFSDTTSGIGEYVGQIDYDHNNNSMNFYADNDQCLRLLNDKSVSVSDKLVLENGTVFLNKHSVGIGTTTQAGRNAGVSTATGTIIYNAETEKVQVYANATWRNVGSLEPDQSSGYYDSLSAAQSAGLSHYWPGNSSTALISGLTPDDRKGNPTFNNKESNGYGATNPFFHFAGQTGGDNPTGYRYTHSADWVGHSFSICYWVKIMQEVTEGESTYVQLGNHSGLRSMFAMSSSGNTNLRGKTITIGDDNANDQIQYEFANWIHVGVRYNYGANSATYYKNGVQTENHTFNGSLSVGTGNNHIYLGYGYWNGSTSNKESCSRMSDIGIWDSTSINGAVFMDIYKAGRIVKGY